MANFLSILFDPLHKCEIYIEHLCRYNKGGLNSNNRISFTQDIVLLKEKGNPSPIEIYGLINKYSLVDLSQEDINLLMLSIQKDALKSVEECWHPLAANSTCSKDKSGKVEFIRAHTIQNNRILNLICENGHVYGYMMNTRNVKPKRISRHDASTFHCFCNIHDKVFNPIESFEYQNSREQNFLFAYRAFIASSVPKLSQCYSMNIDGQAMLDTKRTKEIFDKAIINSDYDVVTTEVFEFNTFYPVSACSGFDLDFDFEGNSIPHSDFRMECIYATLFPTPKKSYFLMSYLTQDSILYSKLGTQLRSRNNLKSDISVLLLSHVENIYYKPDYYEAFMQRQQNDIDKLIEQTQFDFVKYNKETSQKETISLTPDDYLSNFYNVSLFGY